MDVRSNTGKPKRQKFDGEDKEGGSKSLSKLPDVLIGQVLSLLPAKDAIKTSILSKRWEYLWTSIPILNFVQEMDKPTSSFLAAVERALILRGPANIKEFNLLFRGPEQLHDASRVKQCISAMLRHKLEVLSLCLFGLYEGFSLPHSLFTSTTLTLLVIETHLTLKVPCTVWLSSLKTLSLAFVVFSDDYSTQKLFSGCPVLDSLTIRECSWKNCNFVSICAPKLLTLIIEEDIELNPRSSNGCQILVFGASLTYFEYSGEFQNEYCFYNSSVNEASIDLDTDQMSRCMSYGFYKLLRGLSALKILSVESSCFALLQSHASELFSQMPLFKNLITLKLKEENVACSKAVLSMLQNCPCLKTLVFTKETNLSSNVTISDGVLEPQPPCFITSLETIEVHDFYGQEHEICALEILLENAKVLKNMRIICCGRFKGGEEKKRDVEKRLSDLAKGYKSCEVVLV